MTTEEKFRAAVNVIRGLPNEGSFKPSNDLKLKFYGYFKQATEGPNETPKPYMWEVINRAKWEAWNCLGNMTKEDAMLAYLSQLNGIVEKMAAKGNVEEFLTGMDDFYAQVPAKDVDLCIGPTIEKIRAQSASPLPSISSTVAANKNVKPTSDVDEEDDDFFLDSVDTIVVDDILSGNSSRDQIFYANGNSGNTDQGQSTVEILTNSVFTLHKELNDISLCVKKLEQQIESIAKGRRKLFGNLSPQTVIFITIWPILVNLLILSIYLKRR